MTSVFYSGLVDTPGIRLDIIGFMLAIFFDEIILVIGTAIRPRKPRRLFNVLVTGILWVSSFLILAIPTRLLLSTDEHRTGALEAILGIAALLTVALIVIRFLTSWGSGDDYSGNAFTIVTMTAWLAWLVLTTVTLMALHNFDPVLTIIGLMLASFGVIYAVVSRLPPIDASTILRFSLALFAAFALIDLGATFVDHLTTLQFDLGADQQPVIAAVSAGAPGTLNISQLRQGVLTSGLGQSDRVISLNFHGFIHVTKPNFHQIVTLSIHGHLGTSRTQSLVFRATGVPQPGGSLTVTSSRLILQSHTPRIGAHGHATAVLADAVFGTVTFRNHAYTFLLTYEPTGLYLVSGSINLWPHSATAGHAALE